MPYPFSEIMVGDKFTFVEDSVIKVKTGSTTYQITGDVFVEDGKPPETTNEPSEDFELDPSISVVKLLDLVELVEQIQHSIWELCVEDNESYSDTLEKIINNTAEYADEQEVEIVHKVAVMIRDALESESDS